MTELSNKFKNSNGVFFLKALFFETTLADKSTVVYTLKDRDHEGYPSLYLLYLAENDLTEYQFANKYLDGWAHWEALCSCGWFKPYLERWRKELALKHKAEALKRIISEAQSSSRNAFTANKFLVSSGWVEETDKPKRGRPSKKEIEDEKQAILSSDKELQQIAQNLNLKLN